MIRKLTQNDHSVVFPFLTKESSINLFIIGDIEAFGYDTPFQTLWGEWQDGELTAILLKYYESFIFYSKDKDSFDVEGFAKILQDGKQPVQLSGKTELVRRFEQQAKLSLGKKKITYFAHCGTAPSFINMDDIKIATSEDVNRIYALQKSIEEFNVGEQTKKMLQKALETKTGRTFFAEGQNSEIISSVSSAAENSQSAMIVGVSTHKNHRNKGLASRLMKALVHELLKEKKFVCLFYDNPDAGKIYKKIGFEDIGLWTMYR